MQSHKAISNFCLWIQLIWNSNNFVCAWQPLCSHLQSLGNSFVVIRQSCSHWVAMQLIGSHQAVVKLSKICKIRDFSILFDYIQPIYQCNILISLKVIGLAKPDIYQQPSFPYIFTLIQVNNLQKVAFVHHFTLTFYLLFYTPEVMYNFR